MAVPTIDAQLATYSTNFNTLGVASPTTYNLTAPMMAAYTPLHTAFIDAYEAAKADGWRARRPFSSKTIARRR